MRGDEVGAAFAFPHVLRKLVRNNFENREQHFKYIENVTEKTQEHIDKLKKYAQRKIDAHLHHKDEAIDEA